MPHFIYCGYHYIPSKQEAKLDEMLLSKMRKYRIQSSILTMLNMWRFKLITKEKIKKAVEGKLKTELYWNRYEGSINDDLERFFINLKNKKEVKYESVESFFTPKLTNEELKLVQEGNEEHLKSYSYRNPDVDVEEMKKSDSKSKYVHGACWRMTFPLLTSQFEDEMEIEHGIETENENETEGEDEVPVAKKSKTQK